MNTFTKTQDFTPHHAADDVPLDMLTYAKALVNQDAWLAYKPQTLQPDPIHYREWPVEAIAPFNNTLIAHRVAQIGTALRTAFADQHPVLGEVEQAHFHALLTRHEVQALTGDARDIARALHHKATTLPLGTDHVGLDHYLYMRPHMFNRHQIKLSAHIRHWAEHGVEPEAFMYDGPARGA